MLYRLDYTDGMAVRDPIFGGDCLSYHMTTARRCGTEAAKTAGVPVVITRISGAGQMKATLVANPDGTFSRPPGSRAASAREDCIGGGARTCWCSPCRASRQT